MLAGDIIIGRHRPDGGTSFLLSQGPPATLVYGVQYGRPISFLSPYYDGNHSKEAAITSYSPPVEDDCSYPHWHSSYADLENIRRVQLFRDKDGHYCRGLLFDYENGAQRVLGQCRLFADQHQTFARPMSFCFKRTEDVESGAERTRTIVQLGDELVHSHDGDDGWICMPMVGTLGFYFAEPGEQTWLSVSRNTSITGIE